MESDSVLITFVTKTPTGPGVTFQILVRNSKGQNILLLETNTGKTISNSVTDSVLLSNVVYTIRLEDNTLVIAKPDGSYVASFNLIQSIADTKKDYKQTFVKTTHFVYGNCRLTPSNAIEQLENENVQAVTSQPVSSEEGSTSTPVITAPSEPVTTMQKTTAAFSTLPDRTTVTATNTGAVTDDDNPESPKILWIIPIVSLIIIILVVIVINIFKKSKSSSDSLYSSDSEPIEYPDLISPDLNLEDNGIQLPPVALSSDTVSYEPPVSDHRDIPITSPEKKPAEKVSASEKIRNRWSSANDIHLLDFAEATFESSSAIIYCNSDIPPTVSAPVNSAPAESSYHTASTPVAPKEPVKEKAQSSASKLLALLSSVYAADDGIGQLRNAFGSYDVVQFAEVTSNCVVDFSYGIFDNYHLSIDSSDYSSYIIINEKYLMLNPSRFGKINNSVIDGYFLNKMHPEIPFDFFYGNAPVAANAVANSTIEKLIPARIEKRDKIFALVEKGKIYIRR